MRFYSFLLLLLFQFSFWPNVYCQISEPKYFSYDVDQGLPSSEVYDAYQDSLGYLWFTTDRGIARFDGFRFQTLSTKDGLSNNTCFHFMPDKNDMYLNTIDGNLACVTNFKVYKNLNVTNLIHKKKFQGWFEFLNSDEKSEQFTLFSLVGHKSYLVDVKKNKIDTIKLNYTLLNDSISYYDGNKTMLVRFWDKKAKIYDYAYYYKRPGQGNLWCVFSPDLYVRKILCFRNKELLSCIMESTDIKINYVTIIDNLIWACTNQGIVQYDLSGRKINHFLKNFSASFVIKDREGNYWITTLNKGVKMVPGFKIDRIYQPGFNVDKNKIVGLKNWYGNLLVVSSDNQLTTYDPISKAALLNIKIDGTKIPFKVAMLEETVYFNNTNITLDGNRPRIFNTSTSKSMAYLARVGYGYILQRLSNGNVLSIMHLSYTIWDKDYKMKLYATNDSFKKKILSVCALGNKQYLLGTVAGMYMLEENDPCRPKFVKIPGLDSFARINDIKRKENIIIIATTGHGLVITDMKRSLIFTSLQGLPTDLLNNLQIESSGNIWISSNSGLIRMRLINSQNIWNPLSWKAELYSTNNGLSGNYCSDILLLNNNLWISTNNGLNCLNVYNIQPSTVSPKISLEAIETSKRTIDLYGIKHHINFEYLENDIRIRYVGISFDKPMHGEFYQYRLLLDGNTSNWQPTSESTIQFTNLEPGHYMFEVKARNNNNVWSSPSVLKFYITPHFTQTLWFKILIGIAGIMAVVAIVLLILRRQRTKQRESEQLQSAIIRTREAELDTLRNQMNPHFVFNALNSIQSLVYKGDARNTNDFLVRFSSLMRDTLQFSKEGAISLEDEINFLSNYLQIEKTRFPTLFDFQIDADPELLADNPDIPSMLAQPLIENAVKHAFKHMQKNGLINIMFEPADNPDYICVVIADNGSGMKQDLLTPNHPGRKSLGMQIVKERLDLLREKGYTLSHLEFQQENKKGMSTVIKLVLPILN